MKVSELMIGDWVRRESHKNTPQRVMEISENGVTLKLDGGWCGEAVDLIEPIPLTVDILTKNGFAFNKSMSNEEGDAYEFVESQDAMAIVHDFESRHTHLFLFAFNFPMTIERLLVSNVHELQHALRLCGINKEIEL